MEFQDEFFDKYTFKATATTTSKPSATGFQAINKVPQNVAIEVQTRFFASIFRRHEKDPTVDKCEVYLDNSIAECRLVVVLRCKSGKKVYYLL